MAYQANLPSALSLDGNMQQNWKKFIKMFEIYIGATGREKSEAEIIAMNVDQKKVYYNTLGKLLLNIAGEEATAVSATFNLPDDQEFDYRQLVKKFESYTTPDINDTYERFLFNKTRQQESESFDHFLTEARKKIRNCGYGNLADSLLRDKIVEGITDTSVREALFRFKDLTLDQAVSTCRAAEQSRNYCREMNESMAPQLQTSVSVDAIQARTQQPKFSGNKVKGNNSRTVNGSKFVCRNCNKSHNYGQCPAFGKTCFNCNRKNHFQSCCRVANTNAHCVETVPMNDQSESPEEDFNVYYSDSVTVANVNVVESGVKEYRHDMLVEGHVVNFKLDPGAQMCVLPFKVYKSLNSGQKLKRSNAAIKPYGSKSPTIPVLGTVELVCSVPNKTAEVTFHVVVDYDVPLLGINECELFGCIQHNVIAVNSVLLYPKSSNEAGMSVDPERVKALMNIKSPTSRKELQCVLGMFNYVREYIPNMSSLTVNLRQLLKNDVFNWNEAHNAELQRLKELVAQAPVLANFDPSEPIIIQSDASLSGLGCCLLQQGHLVAFASRSLTESEMNYRVSEKELLGICFALAKFHNYVYGYDIKVQTDHKPLVPLMNKQLHKTGSRVLQRLRLKLCKYRLNIEYVPGKHMYMSDFFSRHVENMPSQDDVSLLEIVHSVSMSLPLSHGARVELVACTADDVALQNLVKLCRQGWPNHVNQVPDNVQNYWRVRHDLFVEDGLVLVNNDDCVCVVVPSALRLKMLKLIHEGHLGVEKCKSRAKQVMYWPRMFENIELYVKSCQVCEKRGETWEIGMVIAKDDKPRAFIVKNNKGNEVHRSSKHLKPSTSPESYVKPEYLYLPHELVKECNSPKSRNVNDNHASVTNVNNDDRVRVTQHAPIMKTNVKNCEISEWQIIVPDWLFNQESNVSKPILKHNVSRQGRPLKPVMKYPNV